MTNNSWEDMYKGKESEVLYKICKGFNHPTFEQKELALKILKERKFDFNKANEQLKVWNLTQRKKERELEERYPILTFISHKRGIIISVVSMILLIIILPEIYKIGFEEIYYELRFPLAVFIGGLLVATIFGIYTQIVINRKRAK